MRRLLHVLTEPPPLRQGHYWPPSLETEGFVHLCTAAQLAGVRDRFFAGRAIEIWVLDEAQLSDVRDEDSYGHGAFPHLYGPIPANAIVKRHVCQADESPDFAEPHDG